MNPEDIKAALRNLKLKFRPTEKDDPTHHLNLKHKVGELALVPAKNKKDKPEYFHGIIKEINKTGKVKVFIVEEGLTIDLWLSQLKPIEKENKVQER